MTRNHTSRNMLSTSPMLPSRHTHHRSLERFVGVRASQCLALVLLLALMMPPTEAQEPRRGPRDERPTRDEGQDETATMTLTDSSEIGDAGVENAPGASPPLALAPRPRRQPPPPIRALRTSGLRAEVAALIMSGQSGGQLPIEALIFPVKTSGDKARLPLSLEIPWQQLLASHQEDPLTLELFAYALTPEGGLRGSLMQTFEIDSERLNEEQLAKGGLRFSGEMALEPGTYSLRVMARNPTTGELGLRILDLEVPSNGPLLSPILLEAPIADWQSLHQAYEAGKAPPPIEVLEQYPEAKPVLVSQAETSFRILASGLSDIPSQLSIEAINASGIVLGEIEATIDDSGEVSGQGIRQLKAHFPARLGPGQHLLRARLQGDLGERMVTPALPVIVVAAPSDGALSWAKLEANLQDVEVRVASQSTQSSTADRTSEGRRKNIDTAQMRAAYRELLQTLAEGDEDGASDQLLTLEKEELQQGFDHLEALRAVQLELAGRIAKVDATALISIMGLHHSQYQRTRALRVPLLSTHARTLTLQLIEISLQRIDVPEARRQVVALMTSLGCEAQQAGMVKLSENLLRRVLDLDRDNQTALLSLGFSAERTGDYDSATEYYQRLVDAYPDHGQGLVRLAVNLIREKKLRPARRHLEAAIAGQHSPWILSLAYQEMAKLYLRDNELEKASELMARATLRIPNDEKLYLLQAFVLDASQQKQAVETVLQTMELKARRHRDTSRHRYTEWPAEALEETRTFLDNSTRARAPALQAVLASSEFLPKEGRQ